ncbi:uncharacterized protein [Palaemon carinicauda]|uniref:uncharacterized protein n=1 Tax=Palaemon carinicauda TaxID=392227 RepID=UPI0035B67C93
MSEVPKGQYWDHCYLSYINDLPDILKNDSELYLYADDTKMYRQIKKKEHTKFLHEDIICMYGRSEVSHGNYHMKEQLLEVEHEKDLGVIIDNRLNFSEHLNKKINMANKITGLIRRTFVSLDEVIFKQLCVALVRPHLEYANQAWAPYLVKDIEAIENVQRRATKLVPTLKNFSYEERLGKLKVPTLAYRQARGDMLETFKILSGMYDPEVLRESDRTRGHFKRIYKKRTRLEKRKNSFCNSG